jgi:UDPglucose 6-dehydrogenase
MRLAIIGTGYVGLVSGACLSEFGHEVTCVDINEATIAKLRAGEIPIYEPGLDELVRRNHRVGRLKFTSDIAEGVQDAEAVFIAVGTPSRRGDGHADLSYVFAAAQQVAESVTRDCVIITKSTVPVGTAKQVAAIVTRARPDLSIEVASNPEFLREGSAIEDFMRPDRVVCGTESESARQVLRDIYRPLSLREVPILFVDCETSELIKYAANAFLAVKITFINEIADLCEKTGANVQAVAKGIGMDNRIGGKFLHAGPGYGGSCFPKDTTALLKTAEDYETPMQIVKATVDVNAQRKRMMGRKVIAAAGGSVQDKRIALLGLTFKPNTDDMRDSPSIDIVRVLQDNGARVSAFDPEGRKQAEAMLEGVEFAQDAYDAMDGADVLVLVTEWNEFRALDLDRVKRLLKTPTIVDLRNIYRPEQMRAAGFNYSSIGRP